MPVYHFIKEQVETMPGILPPDRLTSTYRGRDPPCYKWDALERIEGFTNNLKAPDERDAVRKLILGNCEGSMTVVDTSRKGINKLHIGSLTIATPHVEDYAYSGGEGPRADLFNFDLAYLGKMLNELLSWKNPEKRAQVKKLHEGCKWYSAPYRIKQLNISPSGLEKKIQELDKVKRALEKLLEPDFVSKRAHTIERLGVNIVEKMDGAIIDFSKIKHSKKEAKIIVNPDIVLLGDELYGNLQEIFDYVVPKIDLDRARNYWNEIASWEHS
jgi:hypothetical protein